jgi:acetone carboxylase, gamma subunit
MSSYTKEDIKQLISGSLTWDELKRMMTSAKDSDRFAVYCEVLQEGVDWDERILLPLAEHLFIVEKGDERIVKCDCGHEFGDYRVNWKLNAVVFCRESDEEIAEVWIGPRGGDAPRRTQLREFYCPGCAAQLEVEALPPGYHTVFSFLPDLDTFYADWLGEPLADAGPDWFQDRTYEVFEKWVAEDEKA